MTARTIIAAAALTICVAQAATAAPDAELWERWLAHDPGSSTVVDHTPWGELLSHYLRAADDGVNRFDYAAVSADDRAALAAYLDSLAATAVSGCPRNEQLAYWINLYNALTVQVVLEHYPVDSIRDIDISPGFFSDGPWGRTLVTVESEDLSLDDIEHRVLRPIWKDPRIHYALNCASIGCPELADEPFTGDSAERMLDERARAFINHPRGVAVSERGVRLSSLYDWYDDDFGNDEAGILAHIAIYAEPPLAEALAASPSVIGYGYDWRLNDAR